MSNVFNFSQDFINSSPIRNSVDSNREIIQYNLYTIVDTNVPWRLSGGKAGDTCHGLALGSSVVCGKEIDSTVEQGYIPGCCTLGSACCQAIYLSTGRLSVVR